MKLEDMIGEIKADLGADINSLGISNTTITTKINEAVRKVGAYAPNVKTEAFNVVGSKVTLPEGTIMVSAVMSQEDFPVGTNARLNDDQDLFSARRYLFNMEPERDPFTYLIQRTELNNLQSYISSSDYYYDKGTKTLFLSNYDKPKATVKYLQKYEKIEEVIDPDVIQNIKQYAVALCKIVEGGIRRKLQNAPGAIQMDGDSLVSEGISERDILNDSIPKEFSYLRFGIRG